MHTSIHLKKGEPGLAEPDPLQEGAGRPAERGEAARGGQVPTGQPDL